MDAHRIEMYGQMVRDDRLRNPHRRTHPPVRIERHGGFEPRVREWIASFKTFQVKKDYYLELLREQARRDNATAISEGLYPVHVLDIGIVSPEASDGFYYFYPYVLIEVNGLRYKHLTSNFGCAIFRDFLAEWIKARNAKATTTAGGIDNPDFIFCNVRFDSRNGMYRIQ